MIRGDKKAVSAVVATVLIVLITVAAVVLIWTVIIPLVRESSSFSETDAELTIVSETGYTYWIDTNNIACIQIKREADETNVYGVKAIFSVNGSSYMGYFEQSKVPNEAETKQDCFNLSNIGRPSSVAVVPIFSNSDEGSIVSRVDQLPVGGNISIINSIGGVSGSGITTSGTVGRVEPGKGGNVSGWCINNATRSCDTYLLGVCSYGTQTCASNSWGSCVQNVTSSAETCDNLDNDCDGTIDELLNRTVTCGVGICSGNAGIETCSAGSWGGSTCNPFVGNVTEVCGDSLDNDCDGAVDEAGCANVAVLITACGQPINQAGRTYIVSGNLPSVNSITCLNVSANNVTISLNGSKINNTGGYGILVWGYNNVRINNGFIYASGNAIYLKGSNNDDITRIYAQSVMVPAITLESSNNNYFENISSNRSDGGMGFTSSNYNVVKSAKIYNQGYGGIGVDSSRGNNFSNLHVTFNSGQEGIYFIGASSNNTVRDSNISSNPGGDVGAIGSGSVGNVLLNTTYLVEHVNTGSQIIRKWYIDFNVTRVAPSGPAPGSFVKLYKNPGAMGPGSTGSYEMDYTGVDGMVRLNAIQYVNNNGTKDIYSAQGVLAEHPNFGFGSDSPFSVTDNKIGSNSVGIVLNDGLLS